MQARICEDCGALMELGQNRFGQFWKCVRYPDCQGFKALNKSIKREPITTSRVKVQPCQFIMDSFQHDIVGVRKGRRFVIAGAGSGKSATGVEWLTGRIIIEEDFSSTLALVYGRHAGHDLRSKWCARMGLPLPPHPDEALITGGPRDRTTAALCDRAPTIHAWCLRQITQATKNKKPKLEGRGGIASIYKIVSEQIGSADLEVTPLIELYGHATEALCSFASADHLVKGAAENGIEIDAPSAEVLVKVRKHLEKEKILTFPDMLRIVCDYITAGGWPSTTFEPNLKWLFVDEVQDSNLARLKIIDFLANKARASILCGDLRQSIFGFAGARPEAVRALVPESDWMLLPVTRRCPVKVVELANRFCDGKPWNAGGPTIAAPKAPDGEVVKVLDDQWRKLMAKRIMQQMDGNTDNLRRHEVDQVAVIARSRRELMLAECALAGAHIPVRWLGDSGGPWTKQWGKAFRGYLALLSGAVTTSDIVSEAMSRPKRPIGGGAVEIVLKKTRGATTEQFWNMLALQSNVLAVSELRDWVYKTAALPFREQAKLVGDLLMEHATKGREEADWSKAILEKAEIIEALTASAQELGSFSEIEHTVRSAQLLERDAPAVILATVHAAKGLEWKYVHGAAIDPRNFPHHKSKPKDLPEEERIYYVLITRTKLSLTLYAAGEFSDFVEDDNDETQLGTGLGPTG